MSKILSMFGLKKNEDDNIPEVILTKNDPEPYYDKELKVWMIPGQEEEIKKMLAEQKKPPPIGKSKKAEITATDSTKNVDNSLVNPRKQVPLTKKSGAKLPANRYASILPESSIIENNVNNENRNNNALGINVADNREEFHRNNAFQKQDVAEQKRNVSTFTPIRSSESVNNTIEAEAHKELNETNNHLRQNTFQQVNQDVKESREHDIHDQISLNNQNKIQENTLYVNKT